MNPSYDPIAIVGIGCRLPGAANDPQSFWKLLVDGVDAVTELPGERWNVRTFYDSEPGKPGKVVTRWGGFVSDLDRFDADFFSISREEAAWIDPQQRLLLETAWEALEDGGQALERWAGSRVAVFVGISSWDYALAQTSFRDPGNSDAHMMRGNALSFAANRISRSLDFRGPSAAVDTACSSALVAVHLACRSIWVDGCPLALAGGVNVLLMPEWYVGFSRMGMLSPHGRCRAFDARGDGFVRSEGAGMVVLKPLPQALADGDRIYAVIRGTAVNQDGRTNGMTVPSQEAQEALLREACANAGVAPGRIDFVEAHGTGTAVGDPIEAQALGKVLSTGRPADRPCWLGSVKTNIGHLEAGAGMAGLIKAALALHHRCLPGNRHFDQPNPNIDFAGLNLRVPVRCESLPKGEPVLAGITSFGFGGSNAHVILEGPPEIADCKIRLQNMQSAICNLQSAISCLIPLSARSPIALRAVAENLRQFLAQCPAGTSLYDIGFNAALRRTHHDHRLAVVAHSIEELIQRLGAFLDGQEVSVPASPHRPEDDRATLLRSLGQQYVLGQAIDWSAVFPEPGRFVRLPTYPWQRERCWHESLESRWSRMTAPAHPLLGCPLAEPHPCWENRLDVRLFPYLMDHRVQREVIVPATAFLEMAFAAARETFGPAACQLEDVKLANPCFLSSDKPVRVQTSFERESSVVQIHGRLAEEASEWTVHCRALARMTAVDVAATTFDPQAVQQRCPRSFSGAECFAFSRRLGLDYGPAFQGIERVWQGEGEALGLVRLPEGLAADEFLFHPALLDACFQVAICADLDFNDEVGPLYLPSEIERVRFLRRPAGPLWCHARLPEKTARWSVAELDIYNESGQLVLQVRGLRSQRVAGKSADESLDDLLYAYQWESWGTLPACPPRHVENVPHNHWLLFAGRGGTAETLSELLRSRGQSCTLVFPGARFAQVGENRYQVRPGQAEDLDRLLQTVQPPSWGGIVHLWNLDAPPCEALSTPDLEAAQEAGLFSVLHLVQAWDRASDNQATQLFLVTRGAQAVGELIQAPAMAQSPLLGLGRVVVNEYPRLRCKLVDLDPAPGGESIHFLVEELFLTDDEDEIALRANERFVHRFVPAPSLAFRARRMVSERETQVGEGSEAYRLMIPRPGTLDGLVFQALKRRQPGPGEVEIEITAAGLNFSDVMKALGLYPGLGPGPVPLGAECSGRITAVGEDVTELRVGDEVLAVAPFALGSHVTTRAELVAIKPANLSFEEAAAIPIVFLTAAYALEHLARLGTGERVLIHSASGGLGLAAVQLARKAGAEIFATAGTPEKRDFLKEMGIQHVLDSRSLAFADLVLERTGGRGVDVVLNSLAGAALVRSVEVLADFGRFLEVGKRDIYQNARLGLKPFRKNLSFFAVDLDQVMRDRPAFLGAMLRKLVQDFRAGILAPLPHQVYAQGEAVSAFRFMQQAKHMGKIVLSMQEAPAAIVPGDDEPLTFRSDASYLITGGLGGFGLAVARWIVERGARCLVLAGRRGVTSAETQQVLDELARQGAQVMVKQADVAREEVVAALLADIDRSLPPLRGIMHAAMVLEDALLLKLDDDLMRRVLAPKVQGTWNLHVQTMDRPLDFFVMFSSLSSVFGHAGQGNYAAANMFLDALAHHRRARGLPALTVNWGYLGEVGYLAARPQLGERLERQGVMSFSVRQALALLERAMHRQLVQVSVMRVDWSRWRGLGITGRLSPRFAHLLRERSVPAAGADGALSPREALQAAAPEERRNLVGSLLAAKVSRILGDSSGQLDLDKSLVQLGVDSLMAVELRNWIEEELRVTLPIVELMRSPTLARLAELVAELSTVEQAASLALGEPVCLAPETNALFPLSHGQRGLWVMHQMDPASAVHNISLPIRFRSWLDLPVFRRALQALVDRHPSLRTTFVDSGGELSQRVHNFSPAHFEVVDATSWTEEALRQRLCDEAHRPFDLAHGPLFRSYLFTRGPEDHIFLGTVHHIVGDFWSLVVALEEMRLLYAAGLTGAPADSPALPASYGDFVRWQANLLAGPEGEKLWAYWERQLADVPTVLDLPTDRPRTAQAARRGDQVFCRLDADLTRRLKALASREHMTLFTVLLGAFQVVLARYTGSKDLLVGSPVTGRSRPEFANVMGYFINLLPLRARIIGNPKARDFLRQTWKTVLDGLAHQDFPFPLLIERLNVRRQPGQAPLVQVLFALERSHLSGQRGAWRQILSQQDASRTVDSLVLENFIVERRSCQNDLEMVLEEGEETVEGLIRFDAGQFERDTVSRLVGHFQNLLEAFLADLDRPVLELPMLSEAETNLVLRDWNQTQREYPPDLCLHHLFEQQAQRTPGATALIFRERKLTYAELDGWANHMAHRLCRLGVKPDACVALFFERSAEMIASILAVLKAGGAYVPLDPASPPDKLQAILDQVRPPVVLTQRHLAEHLPALPAEVVCLDVSARSELSTLPPHSGVRPDNLAYVIFTSGTTGRPKGVMVEHRSICNTILWRMETLPGGPEDRCLLTIPYFFDVSVCTLFVPLSLGATLTVLEPGEERDPSRLLERVIREQITILEIPPPLLRMCLDHPRFPDCLSLRRMNTGGETLSPDLPGRLFELLSVPFFNLYGPTETAVEATWWKCLPGNSSTSAPIGRPVANAQVYVLDELRQPVPVGVPGELWIGGTGVARGYLNDPERTDERFFPDFFRNLPGARLYRTGDRCRWRADGALEYLGRLDQQVKVRGYRIELEEIETRLAEIPDVREAVVAVHGDGIGSQRLVAYIVPRQEGEPLCVDGLRRHLKDKLPDYALPSAFVALPALPLTPTGKVDRRALPMPVLERPRLERDFVAPRTPLEEFLAELWAELVCVDQVGAEDNFFELGGSSILGVRMINLVQEKLGEHVYVVALFDAPTIAGLARHLAETWPDRVALVFGPESLPPGTERSGANGQARSAAAGKPAARRAPAELVVPLQSKGSRPPLFMVHPPGGIIACYQPLARHLGGDYPFYGIRSRGLKGEPGASATGQDLPAQLEEMAAEYLAGVRALKPHGPYHLGGWSMGGVIALEMARQLHEQGHDVGLLTLLDTTIPYNQANRPYVGAEDQSWQEYGLNMSLEELAQLGPEEQLPYLWDHAKKLGVVDADTPLPLVQRMLDDLKRLFHAHIELANAYPVRPYPGRITLFRPCEAPVRVPTPYDRGWGQVAAGVEVHFVPGQHHSMVQEPHVQALADKLRRCLDQARSTSTKMTASVEA